MTSTQDNDGTACSLDGATLLIATWQPNGERALPSSVVETAPHFKRQRWDGL
ncbi:hypothetical protein K443DRAFT_10526 [Laccaria amethystina LaAM-08-1]|uniref:Uncharacterized protein n=1 Tax=Laccaria amethystina LaAM-08-1 TaxID=1095629 RepID=A0A0C9WVP3_9AGAR|nr:hypothetical protein K443DRAFT_10526 [Laccaria amethystina LaAM-08-1]